MLLRFVSVKRTNRTMEQNNTISRQRARIYLSLKHTKKSVWLVLNRFMVADGWCIFVCAFHNPKTVYFYFVLRKKITELFNRFWATAKDKARTTESVFHIIQRSVRLEFQKKFIILALILWPHCIFNSIFSNKPAISLL